MVICKDCANNQPEQREALKTPCIYGRTLHVSYCGRYRRGNMIPVVVNLQCPDIQRLDKLVERKMYPSRNEAIRLFVKDGLKVEV